MVSAPVEVSPTLSQLGHGLRGKMRILSPPQAREGIDRSVPGDPGAAMRCRDGRDRVSDRPADSARDDGGGSRDLAEMLLDPEVMLRL